MKTLTLTIVLLLFNIARGQNTPDRIVKRDTVFLKNEYGNAFQGCFRNYLNEKVWVFNYSPGHLIFPKERGGSDNLSNVVYYPLGSYKAEKITIKNLPAQINYFIPSEKYVIKEKNRIIWTNVYTHVITDLEMNYLNHKQYPFFELQDKLYMQSHDEKSSLFIMGNKVIFPCKVLPQYLKETYCTPSKIQPYSRFIIIDLDYFLTRDTLGDNFSIISLDAGLTNTADTFDVNHQSFWADTASSMIFNIDPVVYSLVAYNFKNNEFKTLPLPPNPIKSIPYLIKNMGTSGWLETSDFWGNYPEADSGNTQIQEFWLSCIPEENTCVRAFGVITDSKRTLNLLNQISNTPQKEVTHITETIFAVYQYLQTSPAMEIKKEIIVSYKDRIHVLSATKNTITGVKLIVQNNDIQPAVITWHLED